MNNAEIEELISIINFYHGEPSEWREVLKTKYGDRLLRVSSPGIEDMGILDSYRQVQLKENRSGTFWLVIAKGNPEEGCIFPTPWLEFNSTTTTEQLKPFFNLPTDKRGIIKKIEKLAQLKRMAGGQWGVAEKGEIIFL